MWVFGYGSLMWDGWERERGAMRKAAAALPGYRRVFNKKSVRNWGSRKHPGPTLNIEPCEDGICQGVAFEFADADGTAVISYLKQREGRGFALREMPVSIDGGDATPVIVPVYEGPNVFPPSAMHGVVAMVRAANGISGSCADYVRGVARELRRLDIDDSVVSALAGEVETFAYFDEVIERATSAAVVPRDPWSEAQQAKCHENCEAFVAGVNGYAVVRGWLVMGGHRCLPRSVVRNLSTGALVDITPEPSDARLPFVEAGDAGNSPFWHLLIRQNR